MRRRVLQRLARVHARATGADHEQGTTLMELVVGMVLMSICGGIFTAAMVTLSRTTNQTQAITDATSQNNRAFQTLDRTVRYAAAISQPGRTTGTNPAWYVELRDTTGGREVCTQLRVDSATSTLQSRTWNGANPQASLSGWVTLASGITNGAAVLDSATQPLKLTTTGSTSTRQRLRVITVATSGPANQRSSTTSSYTLAALNSTQPPPATPICQQVPRP